MNHLLSHQKYVYYLYVHSERTGNSATFSSILNSTTQKAKAIYPLNRILVHISIYFNALPYPLKKRLAHIISAQEQVAIDAEHLER